VGVATGAVLSYGFDFYLNGVIPFEIERLWFSDSDFSGRLGYGVHSILDIQLKIDEVSNLGAAKIRLRSLQATMKEREMY